MGRYIDDSAARRKDAVFDQCALDFLSAGHRWRWIVAAALFVLSGLIPPGSRPCCCAGRWRPSWRIFALYKTVTAWFHRWTTETDVTNVRVVHKEGFIPGRPLK